MKGDRRKKREEIRRIVAEDDRRRKEKAQDKKAPKKATYRRDKEGNVILWGNLKMSKMAMLVLVGMGAIGVFFYAMSFGVGEMEGYIEPEFSFASCEEGGFTADMCKFHYKFCREYDDGGKLCQFAETDPWINLPDLGDKYTDEEQDFLPPTDYKTDLTDEGWLKELDKIKLGFNLILPTAYGQEPVCYSSACKQAHPDLVNGANAVDPNVSVQKARRSIDVIEEAIVKLESDIRKWEGDESTWNFDLNRMEERFKKGEIAYEKAKTDYRHAFDVTVRTQEDIDDQNKASSDFKQAQLDWRGVQKDWNNEQTFFDESTLLLFEAKKELVLAEDELKDALDIFEKSKLRNRIAQRSNNQFVNIILSDTCLKMIENNFPTECPTYTELRDVWDNTIPHVSGEWVETKYDIKRLDPNYKTHWKYYQSLKNWKIITVDPSADIRAIGVNIIIQPHSFTYLERTDSVLKNESINATGYERYQWKDIQYDKYCSNITIAPDLEMLATAINNIWNGCNTTIAPVVTVYEPTEFSYWDSEYAKYSSWLTDAKEKCKVKC